MTYIKKYNCIELYSNYTIMKMIMIPISDFQEVIFLDMETLPKLVFTTFGTFANFTDQL